MSAQYFVLIYLEGFLWNSLLILIVYDSVAVAQHCYCNRDPIYTYIVQQGEKKKSPLIWYLLFQSGGQLSLMLKRPSLYKKCQEKMSE